MCTARVASGPSYVDMLQAAKLDCVPSVFAPGARNMLVLPNLSTKQRPSCRVMVNVRVTQCCMVIMWWIRNVHEEEALWLCKTPSPVLLSCTVQLCIVYLR